MTYTDCWRFVVFYYSQIVCRGDMLFKQNWLCVRYVRLFNVHDTFMVYTFFLLNQYFQFQIH